MDPRLQQLADLEKIFQEFYDPFLSNQRKTHLGMMNMICDIISVILTDGM